MKKKLARWLLSLSGWKVIEPLPREVERCVMVAAPHTSNWDFYYLRVAFYVLEVPMKVTIKDFWTKFPFGLIIKPLGGLGINRRAGPDQASKVSYVDQMAGFFQQYDRIAMVVAAEGTRSLRTKWKTGFYATAKKAGVPITFGYLDYSKKEAGVGGVLYPSDDPDEDMKTIMDFYKKISPKFPELFSVDQRYA